MKLEPGALPPPIRGFRFAGVHGGLKPRGRRDFALVVADRPAVCAAAFTTNRAAAAPVHVGRRHVANGRIQAVMVNSGSANAATGEKGIRFAEWGCREVAARLSVDPSLVLPCSTGLIGVLPEKVPFARAISLAVDALSPKAFGAAARAIMTSDEFPKWSHRRLVLENPEGPAEVHLAGMAKGAGMINPRMATMLCVVVTDASLSHAAAKQALAAALPRSFNRISVDGDTSTNDTVALLASGQSAHTPIGDAADDGYAEFTDALIEVMDDLARMVIRDGEGATKMVDVEVSGAASDAAAETVARAIACSPLVKTAFAGADPNWGRLVCAIGNAGIDVDFAKLSLDIGDVPVARAGALVSEESLRAARRVMRRDAFAVRVVLGAGTGMATVVTSDLTEAYVRFNSAYSS
jgi:glutamate N-acetyltransferase/amino-acid N-acetyltransferase